MARLATSPQARKSHESSSFFDRHCHVAGLVEQSDCTRSGTAPSQYYGSTEYVSGGIGSDEAQLFRMVRSTFPLSVNFSAQQGERIAYISDVQLVIRNSADQTVLNSLIDGPYCLIRLGPGNYKVFATYEGQTQERQTTLVEGKPQELNFIWK